MEAVVNQADSSENQEKWTLRQKLVGIVVSPRQTLDYLVKNPDWLTPLVGILLVSIITSALVFSKVIDFIISKGNLTINASESTIITLFGLSFGVISAVVGFLMITLFLYMLGTFFLGRASFKEAITIFGYAYFPYLIKGLVLAVSVSISGNIQTEKGLSGIFSNNINSYLKAFFSSIDAFNIWGLALMVIAFSSLFGFSKKKSIALVLALWLGSILTQGAFSSLVVF